VRFIADIGVVRCWADAKDPGLPGAAHGEAAEADNVTGN
jgi:hypothetical protein